MVTGRREWETDHENPPKSLECKAKPKESPEKKLKTLKK